MHSKQYESKKTKTIYILEWREYISKINEKGKSSLLLALCSFYILVSPGT